MTTFFFKILAMLTMVCDHLGDYLFRIQAIPETVSIVMRSIGRCAFLSYAFMMAEGYRHLKARPERFKDHLVKLMLLLLVSEIPYDYFENKEIFVFGDQSVMFLLLIGFVMLAAYEYFRGNRKMQVFTVFSAAAVSFFIHTNYRFAGVLLMLGFYEYLRRFADWKMMKRLAYLSVMMLIYIFIYTWARTNFGGPAAFAECFLRQWPWYITHMLMVIPFALYNGKQGYRSKPFNLAYSWFYPAHLAILPVVRIFAG